MKIDCDQTSNGGSTCNVKCLDKKFKPTQEVVKCIPRKRRGKFAPKKANIRCTIPASQNGLILVFYQNWVFDHKLSFRPKMSFDSTRFSIKIEYLTKTFCFSKLIFRRKMSFLMRTQIFDRNWNFYQILFFDPNRNSNRFWPLFNHEILGMRKLDSLAEETCGFLPVLVDKPAEYFCEDYTCHFYCSNEFMKESLSIWRFVLTIYNPGQGLKSRPKLQFWMAIPPKRKIPNRRMAKFKNLGPDPKALT